MGAPIVPLAARHDLIARMQYNFSKDVFLSPLEAAMRFEFPRKRVFLLSMLIIILLLVLAACNNAPQGPVDEQGNIIAPATVEAVAVKISGDTPPYDVVVQVKGSVPDTCTTPGEATVKRTGDGFQIELNTVRPAKEKCKKEPQSFTQNIPLKDALGLTAGNYVVVVNGVEGAFVLDRDNVLPTPTPTPTPLPPVLQPAIEPPTATPEITPETTPVPGGEAASSESCTNRIKFIKDITIPDNAKVDPGARFIKTWRLKNVGTCTWTEDYQLIFAKSEQMKGPDSQPLGAIVKPNKTVDVSVELTAPLKKGKYTSEWLLQTPAGEKFGLGKEGKTPFWVKIIVPKNAPEGAAALGSISGMVWHDLCASDKATADTLPDGCQLAPGGGVIADGVYQEGEPPIGGAEISLGQGPCPSTGLATTVAEADGRYQFKDLKPGDYCVSIDAASQYNKYIFIPGQWTHPPKGQQTVKLGPGENKTDVNFGWDYELAP